MKPIIISFNIFLFLITTPTKAQTWESVGLDSFIVKQIYIVGDSIWAVTDYFVANQIRSNLYFTSDAGNNWTQLDSVLGNTQVYSFSIIQPETLFIIKIGVLYKSNNNGKNWEIISNINNNPIRWFGISPFNTTEMYAIDLFFAGGIHNNLYKSIDGAENWEMIGPFPSSSHGNELSFAFDLTDSMNLYVGDDDHWNSLYFFKSTDKGENWFYISTPPVLPIGIYTDYTIPNRVYLFPGPYTSNESGLNWFLADSGFTDTSYSLSFYQDKLTTELLYNLRSDGIYSSSNDFIYWKLTKESNSFPIAFQKMRSMLIEPARKELFIGTTEGLYKTTIVTSIIENEKKDLDFSVSQNYPNPFNPITTISYAIPEESFITLTVYDVLGNEIITLAKESKLKGEYKLRFDGTKLTSGIYLYIFTAETNNGFIRKKCGKMLLLK